VELGLEMNTPMDVRRSLQILDITHIVMD
jgi:hypothetical protein